MRKIYKAEFENVSYMYFSANSLADALHKVFGYEPYGTYATSVEFAYYSGDDV